MMLFKNMPTAYSKIKKRFFKRKLPRFFTFYFLIYLLLNLPAAPFLAHALEDGGAVYTPSSQEFLQNTDTNQQKEQTLGTFKQYYLFILGLVGISAFFMITWGGIQYAASGGNPGAITAAKNKIWSALAGIILAGSSYLILRLINPDLVGFRVTTTDVIPPLIIDTAADNYSSRKAGADTVKFTNTCVEEGGRVITPPREGTKLIQRCVPFNSSE